MNFDSSSSNNNFFAIAGLIVSIVFLIWEAETVIDFALKAFSFNFVFRNSSNRILRRLLLLKCGDIETNPCPINHSNSISKMHLNMRSIRNKLESVKDSFSVFEVLCFTETHLDHTFSNYNLEIEGYNQVHRNDVSFHSVGILSYASSKLKTERLNEFEVLIPDSLWIKVQTNSSDFIVCVVYRRPNTSVQFWENLGDVNEDQLNLSNHKLKDIQRSNNLIN